jgi:hypothetical protein
MSVDLNSNLTGGTLTLSEDFQKELEKVFKGSTDTVLKILDNDGTEAPQTLDNGVQILASEKWGDVPDVEVDKDVCVLLGIDVPEGTEEKVMVSYGDFVSKCFDKMSSAFKEGEIDLDKLDGNDIEMLCLLLCQSSKDKLVGVLKNALAAKIDDRNALNQDLINEKEKITAEQVKAAKAAKKSKTRSIFKKIFSFIASAVAIVASAVAAVATAGAGGALFVAACVGLGLSIASATCTAVTSSLSIASMYTSNEKVKARLDKANMAIGIVGAIAGIAASVCSGVAVFKAGKALSDVAKIVQTLSEISDGLVQAAEGSLEVADGIENMKLADTRRNIANININLTKINQGIETLTQAIDSIKNSTQEMIQNILESESSAAKALEEQTSSLLSLVANPV